ncbi:MAG: acyl carrier protein [Candidatus Azotimanducaceae bacterium]
MFRDPSDKTIAVLAADSGELREYTTQSFWTYRNRRSNIGTKVTSLGVSMRIKEVVIAKFHEALAITDKALLVDHLTNDVVLLRSGMDSLGFAVLVALLEEDLGFDPFSLMDEPFYPKTFGEFLSLYQQYGDGD